MIVNCWGLRAEKQDPRAGSKKQDQRSRIQAETGVKVSRSGSCGRYRIEIGTGMGIDMGIDIGFRVRVRVWLQWQTSSCAGESSSVPYFAF